jgi:hypothetical protein
LTDDIADSPAGLHIVQLVTVQTQIFFPMNKSVSNYGICGYNIHSRDKSAVDVRLIEVLDEVA